MPLSALTDSLSTELHHEPTRASPPSSSIKISYRSERSLLTHCIHLLIRPLRNFFGRPKGQQPVGSSRLVPHKVVSKTGTVRERVVEDVYVYDIVRNGSEGQSTRRRIYYFAGGGWQSPPSPQHWQLCAKLTRSLPDTMVSMVSYPLGPKNTAPTAFPQILRLYRALLQAAEQAGETVVLAGDSAGANVALAVTLEALRQDSDKSIESGPIPPRPAALMLTCPSTDLTRSNPAIKQLSAVDPILTPIFIQATAKAWAGDWDRTDRRLSPLFGDVALLAHANVTVHGVTAGYDILHPDAVLFRDKCAKVGVRGEWLHWDRQMHCFLLAWPYGVPEGREAVGWMIGVLEQT